MPKVALAKPISRNQALSYDRTVPNGLGVTAISAVNGRGSYARFAANRYKATRSIIGGAGSSSELSPNGDGMFYYKNKKSAPKMSAKAKKKCAPLVSKAVSEAKAALDKLAKKSKPAKKAKKRKLSAAQKAALKRGQEMMAARRAAMAAGRPLPKKAPKKAAPKKAKKAAKKAAPKRKASAKHKTAPKRKASAKKAAPKRKASAKHKTAPKHAAKKSKKFKRVKALYVLANRKYRANLSYDQLVAYEQAKAGKKAASAPAAAPAMKGLAAYRALRSEVKGLKDAARSGAAPAKAALDAAKKSYDAAKKSLKGKKDLGSKAQIRQAKATLDVAKAQYDYASHIADLKVLEAQSKLPAKKARKARKPVSPRLFGAAYKSKRVRVGKSGHANVVARIGKKGIATYMYLDKKGKARKLPDWMVAGAPSADAFEKKPAYKERLAARRKKAAESVSKKVLAGNYPFTPNKRVVTFEQWAKSMKKKHKKHGKARHNPLMQAAANKKRGRKHRKARRNPLMQAAANKKRSRKHARKHSKRMHRNGQVATYISNMGAYASDLLEVLKSGAVVSGGLIAHKALTNVVVEQAFGKIKFLGKLPAKYQKSVAAVAVAAVGIPLSTKFGGQYGKKVSMGMGAALVHTLFSELVGGSGMDLGIHDYLGSYTEADMKLPMGSYYEFQPGQSYAGMGEYIEQSGPMAGFGELQQAAAGFGSPALMQAAAGVGEYIVSGAEGIGEYEQVRPEYTAPHSLREGIAPSLGSAEQALNIAEAAAGVGGLGNQDLSLEQTVYPQGQALDIGDQPGGSRAGVFYGGNGVFGP